MALTNSHDDHSEVLHTEAHAEHAWPHIPSIQGEQLAYGISNTVVTTIIFALMLVILAFVWNRSLKNNKKSKFKTWIITFIKFFDNYLRWVFWNKELSRKYFPLVTWIFIIIFFWNLFWLLIDWLWASVSETIFHYLRPMHSDLNTTLVLAAITVVSFLAVWVQTHWAWHTIKWYLFNYTWKSVIEKSINVFVWWLHMISIPATLASLSLRLFGNIFAWIVLIWVITYLWASATQWMFGIWSLFSVPFWLFEFFVAFIQSVVFAALIISYINQAKESH